MYNSHFEINHYLSAALIPGGTMVKNLPANAGDTRDEGLIPGLGRSPEEEMATHSGILAWKRSWIEEPGGL